MLKKIRLGGKAFALATAAILLACAVAWAADLLTVIESEASIRRDKKSYSPRVAVVKEGEQVTLLAKEDPWLRVEFKGVEGWMNVSSVTEDPHPVLSSDAVARGARATEQSAAGKGFTPEVEKEYRKTRPNLDTAFKFLDTIQEEKIPEEIVIAFLKAGQLIDAGGGK
jgi:hypothetical protein